MIFSMGKLYRIIFFIAFLFPTFLQGQTIEMDDEQVIAQATEEFNAGHFYSVPSLLGERLKGFNRNQRQRAYLLLTQTYLLLDDPIGAERSYLEVLAANPEFVPDEQLHAIDIVYFSKRFTATPKFSWFVGAGSNVSPARLIRHLDVFQQENDSYSLLAGYHFGAGGEYSYNDNIKLRLETNLIQTRYKANINNVSQKDSREFIERQIWLNVPLYVSYSDNIGKYRPYAYAGYSFSKLFADKASMTSIKQDDSKNTEGEVVSPSLPIAGPELNFLKRRMDLNQSLIFGAGIKYKIGLDFVFVDARYSAGLKNIVNPDYPVGDPTYDRTSGEWVDSSTPTTAHGYRDDYIRMDNIALTIGFLRPLYKPRALKHARTKGVLRKIKRGK
jgi:hypothetical protein